MRCVRLWLSLGFAGVLALGMAGCETGGYGGGADCDSNYTGCVPIASDVDCAGGSGDGPEYTGAVEVTGSDVYDLDADGDGAACE